MTSDRPPRPTRWVLALALVTAVGCGGDDASSTVIAHHGLHGGHLAVMSEGAGFEMEFTLDEKHRRMVIYVQEPDSSTPHPLATHSLAGQFVTGKQSVDVAFVADPREEDPEGQSSRFALDLDEIPQQLLASNDFELRLSHEADGNVVTASIPHEGNHGHEYNHD